MIGHWTCHHQSSFFDFNITHHMILSGFPDKNSISRLIYPQPLINRTLKIDHIFNLLIYNIIITFNKGMNFLQQLILFILIHDKIIQDHHSRMRCCISSCNIKGTKIIHYFLYKLWSSFLWFYWLVYAFYIVFFLWFSLLDLVYAVSDEVHGELFVFVYLMGY